MTPSKKDTIDNKMKEAIGFKEWRLVIDRLGNGEQSLLLRKGGIHEGKDGFAFAHKQFFLLPSYFHQQTEQLRLEKNTTLPPAPEGVHSICYVAKCLAATEINKREEIDALRPFHCWSDELLEQRWNWAGKSIATQSLTVALVRIYQFQPNWEIVDGPRFKGCRSWFALGEAPKHVEKLTPVLGETSHEQRLNSIVKAAPSLTPQSTFIS